LVSALIILYGGSVKACEAGQFVYTQIPRYRRGLIGGASLVFAEFMA